MYLLSYLFICLRTYVATLITLRIHAAYFVLTRQLIHLVLSSSRTLIPKYKSKLKQTIIDTVLNLFQQWTWTLQV